MRRRRNTGTIIIRTRKNIKKDTNAIRIIRRTTRIQL